MSTSEVETEMEFTPTDAGRDAKVREWGIEGGFKMWLPVMLSGAISLMIILFWLTSKGGLGWKFKVGVGLMPFAITYTVVRYGMAGQSPHYMGDMITMARSLKLDWEDPALNWLPVLPRFRVDLSFHNQAFYESEHPLAYARRIFKDQRAEHR